MPIDEWTPPAVKPMFEGLQFKSKSFIQCPQPQYTNYISGYNMSQETRHDTLNSNFGDSEPGTYEKGFAGVTEVMDELSGKFQSSSLPRKTNLTTCSHV